MVRRISLWVKEHQLITYFVLAYAISWIIVAPLVASAQSFIDVPVPFALHYLTITAPYWPRSSPQVSLTEPMAFVSRFSE